MILTNDFVFIHQPKTGGTFVTEVLARLYEPVRERGMVNRWLRSLRPGGKKRMRNVLKHGTCNEIPIGYRHKPILGTVRNPYDRYVSQYEFGWWKEFPESFCSKAELAARFPRYPDLTFEEFIDLCNSPHLQSRTTRESPRASPGRQTRQFVNYFFMNPDRVLPKIDEDYVAARKYETDMFPVHFLHTDRLNPELHAFLLGLGFDRGDIDFILATGKIFPPEGGRGDDKPWQKYYTPELKRKVRIKEQLLFALFPEMDV